MTESVAAEADRIVDGDRQDSYGHPFVDMSRTGRLIEPIIEAYYTPGEPLPPEAVALIMVQVKISRECNRPKRDNRVDGIGYFKCLDMIHEYRREQAIEEIARFGQTEQGYTGGDDMTVPDCSHLKAG